MALGPYHLPSFSLIFIDYLLVCTMQVFLAPLGAGLVRLWGGVCHVLIEPWMLDCAYVFQRCNGHVKGPDFTLWDGGGWVLIPPREYAQPPWGAGMYRVHHSTAILIETPPTMGLSLESVSTLFADGFLVANFIITLISNTGGGNSS